MDQRPGLVGRGLTSLNPSAAISGRVLELMAYRFSLTLFKAAGDHHRRCDLQGGSLFSKASSLDDRPEPTMTSTVPADGSLRFRLGKPRPTNPGLKRVVDMMNPSSGCRSSLFPTS